jgi:hypothetical protein
VLEEPSQIVALRTLLMCASSIQDS